jgi:hypothetical protein
MKCVVLCVIALSAASVGQQQETPKPTGRSEAQSSSVMTVDPSQVIPAPPAGFKLDAPVPQSGQKVTVPKARSKAPTFEMQVAALCARDMEDALDKLTADNPVGMEKTQLEGLHHHALDCLDLQKGASALRDTALVLNQTASDIAWEDGFDFGTKQASEARQAAISEVKRSGETERNSIIHDYDALVDRYNSLANEYNNHDAALVNQYNSLVNDYNKLLGLARQLVALPPTHSSFSPMPPPSRPPREIYLNCTATPLPGNSAAINCW